MDSKETVEFQPHGALQPEPSHTYDVIELKSVPKVDFGTSSGRSTPNSTLDRKKVFPPPPPPDIFTLSTKPYLLDMAPKLQHFRDSTGQNSSSEKSKVEELFSKTTQSTLLAYSRVETKPNAKPARPKKEKPVASVTPMPIVPQRRPKERPPPPPIPSLESKLSGIPKKQPAPPPPIVPMFVPPVKTLNKISPVEQDTIVSFDSAGSQGEESDDYVYYSTLALTSYKCRQKVSLEFDDMRYSVWEGSGKNRKEKVILKGIHGRFKGGQLHCIMGPSGSGKTTLLNTLAGFNTEAARALRVVVADEQQFEANKIFAGNSKLFCYITQDIELPGFLTVEETMNFAVQLKMLEMPHGVTVKEFVYAIARRLRLHNSLDTYVYQLSGGQRKRLAIATELVNYPPVLFADEPTSGLDSAMAEDCVDLMREMAQNGCNVICTIHQPSAKIFETFHTLYCISNGLGIYEGSTAEVVSRLNSAGLNCPAFYSPADFILDVALGECGFKNLKKVISSNEHMQAERLETELKSRKSKRHGQSPRRQEGRPDDIKRLTGHFHSASFLQQTGCLTKRLFRTTTRNHLMFAFRIMGLIGVGVLIGAVFFHDDAGKSPQLLAILASALVTVAFMPTVLVVPLDIKFMVSEFINSWYNIFALSLATFITDTILELGHPIVYTVLIWMMANFRENAYPDRMMKSCVISVLNAWVGRSLGLLIGSGCNKTAAAYAAFGMLAPIFIFTGSVLPVPQSPVYWKWLFYINPSYYAFWGHLQEVWGGNYNKETGSCYGFENRTTTISRDGFSVQLPDYQYQIMCNGTFILNFFGFENDDVGTFPTIVGAMLGLLFLFRIAAAVSLYFRLAREFKQSNNR